MARVAWQTRTGPTLLHKRTTPLGGVHLKGKRAKVVAKQSRIARTLYPHVQPLSLHGMLQGAVEEGPKDDMAGLSSWIRVWISQTELHFAKGQERTEPVLAVCACYLALLEKFLSWVEQER